MIIVTVLGGKGHNCWIWWGYDCWIWWLALYTCASTRGKLKTKWAEIQIEKILTTMMKNDTLEVHSWGECEVRGPSVEPSRL